MGRNLFCRYFLPFNFLIFSDSDFRVYEGHMPVLIVADAEMVQEIYIKQFSNFSARRVLSASGFFADSITCFYLKRNPFQNT